MATTSIVGSGQLSDTVFAGLVALGVRAPSLHNSQPWRFRRHGDAVEILADPERALPVTDPAGWGLRLAVGAAAYDVRLGYAALGWATETTAFPDAGIPGDPGDPGVPGVPGVSGGTGVPGVPGVSGGTGVPGGTGVLVRIRPVHPRPATPDQRRLLAAIPRRHTNRRPYRDAAVPDAALAALADAAAEDACRVTVLGPREVGEVAALIRDADAALEANAGYAAERRRWLRGRPAADGVRPDRLAGRPDPDERLRRRDFGARLGTPARRYESDPCLLVLSSPGSGRYAELRAGQALQHVLLRATAAGLATSLYSQPIEVEDVRARLATLTGGTPQMVLRIGYGPAHGATPRRPVADVIIRDLRP